MTPQPEHQPLDAEDYLYATALTVIWVVAFIVIAWKTVMFGGLPMLPTFLILEGMFSSLVFLAWVKTR